MALRRTAEAWDLGDEAAVRRRLRLELDDVARKRALQGYEIPRDFILEREPFSKANHLLTDSGKPAMGRLREKCAPTPCIRWPQPAAWSGTVSRYQARGRQEALPLRGVSCSAHFL